MFSHSVQQLFDSVNQRPSTHEELVKKYNTLICTMYYTMNGGDIRKIDTREIHVLAYDLTQNRYGQQLMFQYATMLNSMAEQIKIEFVDQLPMETVMDLIAYWNNYFRLAKICADYLRYPDRVVSMDGRLTADEQIAESFRKHVFPTEFELKSLGEFLLQYFFNDREDKMNLDCSTIRDALKMLQEMSRKNDLFERFFWRHFVKETIDYFVDVTNFELKRGTVTRYIQMVEEIRKDEMKRAKLIFESQEIRLLEELIEMKLINNVAKDIVRHPIDGVYMLMNQNRFKEIVNLHQFLSMTKPNNEVGKIVKSFFINLVNQRICKDTPLNKKRLQMFYTRLDSEFLFDFEFFTDFVHEMEVLISHVEFEEDVAEKMTNELRRMLLLPTAGRI